MKPSQQAKFPALNWMIDMKFTEEDSVIVFVVGVGFGLGWGIALTLILI